MDSVSFDLKFQPAKLDLDDDLIPQYEQELWSGAVDAILSQEATMSDPENEILPWLCVGGKRSAEMAVERNYAKYTHILNCCEPWIAMGINDQRLKYLGFEASDYEGYPILHHYENGRVYEHLKDAQDSGGKCLVHCAAGINRSVSIVIAFLIDELGMDLLSAIEFVKDKRPVILGNHSFRNQLIQFAYERDQLGSLKARDEWYAKRPIKKEVVSLEPQQEWFDLAINIDSKVRVRECGSTWTEGTVEDFDGEYYVVLLDGAQNKYDVDYVQAGPDICAIPQEDVGSSA